MMARAAAAQLTFSAILSLMLLMTPTKAQVYHACESVGTVTDATITDCHGTPCHVHAPNKYAIEVDFQPANSARNLSGLMDVTLQDGTVFPFSEQDACKYLVDASCPIEAGSTYKLRFAHQVEAWMPAITVGVTMKVEDENSLVQACVMFMIEVDK